MDRYGEIYTTYQMILDGAAKAPKATILANGDSPLFNSKEVVNPVRFYGFDTEKHDPELAHYNTEALSALNVRVFFSIALILTLTWETMCALTATSTVQN